MVNSKTVQIRENEIRDLQLLEAPILYQLHCDGHSILKTTTVSQPRRPHLYLRSDLPVQGGLRFVSYLTDLSHFLDPLIPIFLMI
jgi:hypothetical protein